MIREKLSFVIPCYQSEHTIRQVVSGIIYEVDKHIEYDYEIILINDGSTDNTWDVLKCLAQTNNKIKAVNLSKNFGQHSALMAGYRCVTGDYIVGLDDDGEHDPQYIFCLVDKIKQGYDYVCAYYGGEKKKSWFRNLGTRINNWMASTLISKPDNIMLSSFYIEKRFVTEQIIKTTNPFPYVAGLLLQSTNNMAMVELPKGNRIFGKSGYTFKKLFNLWFNGVIGFSVVPLRLASLLGLTFSIMGFVLACVFIIRKFIYSNILPGYSSMISVILIIGGITMMLLGLIGEYIGRMYIAINGAPQYVIKDRINL